MKCLITCCDKSRDFTIGNERYFCKKHGWLSSIYTRVELEQFETNMTHMKNIIVFFNNK